LATITHSIPSNSRTHRNFRDKGYWLFLAPGAILFVGIIILPFLMTLGMSFTRWTGIGRPEWIGLDNYVRAFRDQVFWASFGNNIQMIFSVTVIPTIAGLLLSVFMFEYGIKHFGKTAMSFFRMGYYLPQILPVAIAGVVWRWILNPNYGVLNWLLNTLGLEMFSRNWLGDPATALPSVMVVMVWFQLGYPLVIFMSALQRIDQQVLEAAQLDGAGWFQRLRIILALIQSEVSVVLLTTTIFALKLFAQIFVLTRGGPGNATLVPSYFAYQNYFEKAQVGYGATISIIMTSIILLLTWVFISVQNRSEEQGGLA
jgi:raffinose/stachyose/melibiose transport system permease protein